MNKIRINQGRIVPAWLRALATLGVFVGMYAALSLLPEMQAIFISISLSAFLPFIWSSYLLLEIDQSRKSISKIRWIAGFRQRKTCNYEKLLKVIIVKTEHLHGGNYQGYIAKLITETGQEHYLLSAFSHDQLIRKLTPVTNKLDRVAIEDLSS